MTWISDQIVDEISARLGPVNYTPSGYYKRNCMMCHHLGHGTDTRSRFGIRYDSESTNIHCFNCGLNITWFHNKRFPKQFILFLEEIGFSRHEINKFQFQIITASGKKPPKNSYNYSTISSNSFSLIHSWKPIDTSSWITLSDGINQNLTDQRFLDVAEYAMLRNLEFGFDHLYWDRKNKYRLIIPFTYKNKIVGFTSRMARKSKSKTSSLSQATKYYMEKPNGFLMNYDSYLNKHRTRILMVEGALDAFYIDAMGILRNRVSKDQLTLLNQSFKHKEKVVVPDRNYAGIDFINQAIANNWSVAFPNWSNDIEDVGDAVLKYGRILTLISIFDSIESRINSIKLKKQKLERSIRDGKIK